MSTPNYPRYFRLPDGYAATAVRADSPTCRGFWLYGDGTSCQCCGDPSGKNHTPTVEDARRNGWNEISRDEMNSLYLPKRK